MTRILRAIETAGGLSVWIKLPRVAGASPSAAADTSREILVATSAWDAVVAAVANEAKRVGLEAHEQTRLQSVGLRSAEIRITRGHELVGRLHLREVTRLRRAAIVIDDLGMDLAPVRRLLELPCPLTFSVLPHLRHSTDVATAAHRASREVILHLPMQPESGRPTGPGEIRVGMTNADVRSVIESGLATVPYAAGANNHMGSRATVDATLMADVMKTLARHRLFFVDSRTTTATVAFDSARREGIPAFYRSVFLDDTKTVDYSLGQLRKFRRAVQERGAALAIGHPYPTTIQALAEFCPEFERDDIELVSISAVVRLPEVARLAPPRRPM